MNCRICESNSREVFKTKILNKYDVSYFVCDNCGFLQTENPYWLEESYKDPINPSDTGYVSRNVYLSKKTLSLFTYLFGKNHTYLDYAGGYGMLTRLMRDYGLNFLWDDPHTPNLFANGFVFKNEEIKAITCFECFEHFASPLEEIDKILKISKNVFFSTRLIPDSETPSMEWPYYGFRHGQHVSLYSKKTLEFIAKKYCLNFYSDGKNLHLFTEKKISNFTFNLIMTLSRLPLEILIKKLLISYTEADSKNLSSFEGN